VIFAAVKNIISTETTYSSGNSIERLQAWSLSPLAKYASKESVELAGTVLVWSLASTNRKYRDRSTRSLVSLFIEKQDVLLRILKRFKDNNDPYITERLYASVYGAVSINSNNRSAFRDISKWIYKNHFLNTERRPDALIDDYAKGIIELYLRVYRNNIRINTRKISPPFSYYKFPKRISSMKYLRAKYHKDTVKDDQNYYSIWGSVMYGEGGALADFGNYTMGSVLGELSNIKLSEKPPRVKDASDGYRKFIDTLSTKQRELYNKYNQSRVGSLVSFVGLDDEGGDDEENARTEVATANALRSFEKSLGLLKLRKYRKVSTDSSRQSGSARDQYAYDLNIARRWIFSRVIKLGWNPRQHMNYDRSTQSYYGTSHDSLERIGKKYQWIALSEFLAIAGSNYYLKRDRWSRDIKFIKYNGSYQTSLRDFDPTLDPLWLITKSDDDQYHTRDIWWAPDYNEFENDDWQHASRDIPSPKSLIEVSNGSVSYLSFLSWQTWKGQGEDPADKSNNTHPELWMHINGYIVRKKDMPKIEEWCERKEFYNSTLPEPHDESSVLFLKEMFDGVAYKNTSSVYHPEWLKKGDETPFDILPPIEGYNGGSFERDSTSRGIGIYMPSVPLQKILKLRQTEKLGEYVSKNRKVTVFDPSVDTRDAHSSLMANKDELIKALNKKGLTVIWSVLGEKLILGGRHTPEVNANRLEVHGFCYLDGNNQVVENIRFKNESDVV
jgi:hypothetical protein